MLRWLTLPIPWVPPTDVAAAVARLPPGRQAAARALLSRHDTAAWRRRARPWEIPECLYVLLLLEEALPPARRGRDLAALDVGARSWPYLAALLSAGPARWDGVELHGHARLGPLQTRASVARWRTRGLPGVRWRCGPVEAVTGRYDLVTWFLPFVTEAPHRAWGLPAHAFDPPRLLAHVAALVRPGGALLITNQGPEEAEAQRRLLEEAGLRARALGCPGQALSPFERERPAWLVER